MAFGFCRTSAMMPSEDGSNNVFVEKSVLSSLLPRRKTVSRKYTCVPELVSRESRTMGLSSPPTSFQLVILPLYMSDICLRVSSFLFSFYLAGCVGEIHCPINKRRDSCSGPAACYRYADIWMLVLISFSPGERQVNDGIRPFIFNIGSGCFRVVPC